MEMTRREEGKGKRAYGNGRLFERRPFFIETSFALFLLTSLLFLALGSVHAESSQESFKRGNQLYADGKFAESVAAYDAAREAGLHHWALFYNRGNAHYRSGHLGKAVADYGRAFRLNSSQGDVVANLRLTTEKVGEPIVPSGTLAAVAWRLFYSLSINTLTILVSLLFLALMGLSGWSLWRRAVFLPDVMAGAGVALLLSGCWLAGRAYLLEQPLGVITMAPAAEVRSGPNTTYPANFTVPEGRRVLILDEVEPVAGWLEIGVPKEGLKGWVPDTAVDIL